MELCLLSSMDKEKNFDDVLKRAKNLGYAESNFPLI